MKKLIALAFGISLSGQAFCGVVIGGTSGMTIGEARIDPSEIETISEGRLSLKKSHLLDVVAGSLREKPMTLDGEPVAAEHFDFANGTLSLRSLSKPNRVITLEPNAGE